METNENSAEGDSHITKALEHLNSIQRRVRELEELRAKSGGVTIGTNSGNQQTSSA